MISFDLALAKLLSPLHEGRTLSLDPNDSGNYTPSGELKGSKFGISAKIFPSLDIANLSEADAGDIYRKSYWQPEFEGIADHQVGDADRNYRLGQAIVDMAFDSAVSQGVTTSIRLMQLALSKIVAGPLAVDGRFGPRTLEATNAADPLKLLTTFTHLRIGSYRHDPGWIRYADAWTARSFDWF
jgi:lysozyme family protein